MIKIRIKNADHEIDVQFPISENKLYNSDYCRSRYVLCAGRHYTACLCV